MDKNDVNCDIWYIIRLHYPINNQDCVLFLCQKPVLRVDVYVQSTAQAIKFYSNIASVVSECLA